MAEEPLKFAEIKSKSSLDNIHILQPAIDGQVREVLVPLPEK